MKGIVLAGGAGKRLYPVTKAISKHLIPVYDKPLIYYSLSVLMLAGIKQILIITTIQDQGLYKRLLGDGSDFGVEFHYETQAEPAGVAQAFLIGKKFISGDPVCLVLGDNVFFGQGFRTILNRASAQVDGATIFAYHVKDPQRFGVVEFDSCNTVLSLEEKPEIPKSNFAVTGLYFYDGEVVEIAASIPPSSRNELEITSINEVYRKRGKLTVETLGRGFTWFDAGTHSSLLDAAQFVETVQSRHGHKVACLEEIAFINGWISSEKLRSLAMSAKTSDYSRYLLTLV